MRVSSVGGIAMTGQTHQGMQKTQARKECGELVRDCIAGLLQPWWDLSWHWQSRTFSCASANKDVTQLSLLLVPSSVWGVAGVHWLWLQASSRRGLCSCVSLILCLPVCRVCLLEHNASPTLLPVGHLQADSHPERPLSTGQASVIDAAADTQRCVVCLTPVQPICAGLV